MHKVTCYYCRKLFDRDSEPYIEIATRRYAHEECVPDYVKNKPKEDKSVIQDKEYEEYEELSKYIKQLFKMQALTPVIVRQIKEYKQTYNYSYSGMKKALYWYYELKRNSIKKSNGTIGIIPYIYDKALDYYYHLYLGQIAAAEETVPIPKTQRITIQSPQCTPELMKRKLFILEDEDE